MTIGRQEWKVRGDRSLGNQRGPMKGLEARPGWSRQRQSSEGIVKKGVGGRIKKRGNERSIYIEFIRCTTSFPAKADPGSARTQYKVNRMEKPWVCTRQPAASIGKSEGFALWKRAYAARMGGFL